MTANPRVTAPFRCAPDTWPNAPTRAVRTSPKANAMANEFGGVPPVDLPRVAAAAVAVPVKMRKKVPTASATPARIMFGAPTRCPCSPRRSLLRAPVEGADGGEDP